MQTSCETTYLFYLVIFTREEALLKATVQSQGDKHDQPLVFQKSKRGQEGFTKWCPVTPKFLGHVPVNVVQEHSHKNHSQDSNTCNERNITFIKCMRPETLIAWRLYGPKLQGPNYQGFFPYYFAKELGNWNLRLNSFQYCTLRQVKTFFHLMSSSRTTSHVTYVAPQQCVDEVLCGSCVICGLGKIFQTECCTTVLELLLRNISCKQTDITYCSTYIQ